MSNSAAERLQLITELLDDNVYDDFGNVIGKKEPLITKEQALELLNAK